MVDTLDHGRRPLVVAEVNGRPADTTSATAICPGVRLEHPAGLPDMHLAGLGSAWGPVLEIWEGWACDEEIRFRGSSGGAASALALYAIEKLGMSGVLHTAPRSDIPFLNKAVLSRSRDEILAGSGSRYAPAGPCERLDLIEDSPSECVLVGKPCDVAGARAAASRRPGLDRKLGLTIAVFCAGTPSTAGTLSAIRTLGVDPADVTAVRYRGSGWPGRFTVTSADGEHASLSYEDSWGSILQTHRQWRCMICPDHTGEFADISVGDPWYREVEPGEPGRSLVLARTERGRAAVRRAIESGYVALQAVEPDILPLSQPNLLQTRGAVWGRLVTMAALRLPVPRFHRLPTFATWRRALGPAQKLRSFTGTARRIVERKLYRRVPVRSIPGWNPEDPDSDTGAS